MVRATLKLVRVSDVEFYLRRTAANMIAEAEKDAETITDDERAQVGACVLAINELARNAYRLPTVEIVRCRDCKYIHSSEFCECRPDDAFCSDGAKMYGGAEG